MPRKKEPVLEVITTQPGTGRGRRRQPIEKREVLSDKPHKNRKGPKDISMAQHLPVDSIPEEPPIPLTEYERECWDIIAESQRAMGKGAWIYRSDCSYLIATCGLYGRWREVREELNAATLAGLALLGDDGKANPLVSLEASLATKYQASLAALGMVPTRRMLAVAGEEKEDAHGLLA